MNGIRIEPLGAREAWIALFAAAYEAEWPDWYGAGGPGDARDYLRSACGNEIPAGFVALSGDVPAGTVILGYGSAVGAAYPGPWISSLYVVPAFRGHGLAMRLIAAAESHAQALNLREIYIGVTDLEDAILRRGYAPVCREMHGGKDVAILRKNMISPN